MNSEEDLRKVLGVICNWHSRIDCVSDLKYILPIANKHNIKLDIAEIKDMILIPLDYDIDEKMLKDLKYNKSLKRGDE